MANNFTGDPNCVALWRFEDGALTADSIGANTLTNVNGVVSNQVAFMEGAASADFEAGSSQYMSITDADLDAGVPLKDGDANKKISVCGWFQPESFPGPAAPIYTKYDYGNGRRSLEIILTTTNKINVTIGHSGGGSWEVLYEGGSLLTGRFYHFGFTFQDSDGSWKLVVWDNTSETKKIIISGTAVQKIHIDDAPVGIGTFFGSGTPGGFFDGEMDEVVVFKDILTAAEIDQIRAGTYGAGSVVSLEDVRLNLSAYHQDLSDLAAWLKAHDGLEFEDLPSLLAAFLQDTEDLPAHLIAGYQDLPDLMLSLQISGWSLGDARIALETQGLSLSDLTAAFAASGWGLGDIETFLTATDAIVRKDLAAWLRATDGIVTGDFPVCLSAIGLVPAFRSITAQRLTSVITEVV